MSHKVTLTWTASTDAIDGYNLYRGTAAGQESTLLNSSLVTALTFVDASPLLGHTFYVAKAVSNGVESLASNEVTAVLLPSAPTNLTITIS
jgi:hypothetical protein